MPELFVHDADLEVWLGDAVESLQQLPEASAQVCVTSPPFYGLRDYGTGTWVGGDPECDHLTRPAGGPRTPGPTFRDTETEARDRAQYPGTCGKCGAQREDRQIGLEQTLDEFIGRLVDVFREVRRVLRPDGTLWLEMADSYGSGNRTYYDTDDGGPDGRSHRHRPKSSGDVKPKDLYGAPFELALALRADGWYWRQTIIWHKRSAMPESAKDRPTTSHSYVFLMAASERYYFDADAIAEPAEWLRWGDQTNTKYEGVGEANASWIKGLTKEQIDRQFAGGRQRGAGRAGAYKTTDERSARFQGTHATPGIDPDPLFDYEGGEPGERQRRSWHDHSADLEQGNSKQTTADGKPAGTVRYEGWQEERLNGGALTRHPRSLWSLVNEANRLAVCSVCEAFWDGDHPEQHCDVDVVEHFAAFPRELARRAISAGSRSGDVVLDPFGGSGTTAMAARELGRKAVLVELRREYAVMIRERTRQGSLLGG